MPCPKKSSDQLYSKPYNSQSRRLLEIVRSYRATRGIYNRFYVDMLYIGDKQKNPLLG